MGNLRCHPYVLRDGSRVGLSLSQGARHNNSHISSYKLYHSTWQSLRGLAGVKDIITSTPKPNQEGDAVFPSTVLITLFFSHFLSLANI
jgi:hypothetical protein